MGNPALRDIPREEVPLDIAYRVERFLSLEARVLDEERYIDWLALLTEDVRYRMPIPRNTKRKNRSGTTSLGGDGLIYDETLPTLRQRALREDTGLVWLNDPPTHHVRLITNVETFVGDTPGTYDVRSKFMLFRARRDRDRVSHVGWREDVIAETPAGLRIASCTVYLPERVITDKNLNTFF